MNPLMIHAASEVHSVYLDACADRDRIAVMIADDTANGDTSPGSRIEAFRDAQITVVAFGEFWEQMTELEAKK